MITTRKNFEKLYSQLEEGLVTIAYTHDPKESIQEGVRMYLVDLKEIRKKSWFFWKFAYVPNEIQIQTNLVHPNSLEEIRNFVDKYDQGMELKSMQQER